MSAQPSDVPVAGIDAAVGNQGSELWGYVVVGVVVLAAVIYLVRQFGPSRKSCCSGCGESGTCAAADLVRPKETKP